MSLKFLLLAKAWQIIALIFGLLILNFIVISFAESIVLKIVVFPFFIIIYFLWIYSLGINLYAQISQKMEGSTLPLHATMIIFIGSNYGLSYFFLATDGMLQDRGILGLGMLINILWFYATYFAARILALLESEEINRFKSILRFFILLLIFPFGIMIIQPYAQNLLKEKY